MSTIFGGQYVLLLGVRPGDETRGCGGFIAEGCARGRPPFVCVVTDGSSAPGRPTDNRTADEIAQERADRTRLAASLLGLPEDRLLLFGLYDGSVPQSGPRFVRLVEAVADIARRYDCGTVCAPLQADAAGDHLAVEMLARALAAHSGLGLVWRVAPPCRGGVDLDAGGWAALKLAAAEIVAWGPDEAKDAMADGATAETYLPG